jgi:methionyl-tRNA formyltransferase
VRVAVAASPQVAIPTIEALLESSHELVRIISQPDRPAGRGKVLTPTPVSQWAIDHEVELVRPATTEEIAEAVAEVDCVLTIGYGVLLPESILEIPSRGFLNLHFSLLPRWRGAAPVQRAIEAGDSLTGVTVFKLDAGMDTGPIYTVHRYALDSDITSDELLVELGEVGVGAVLEALDLVSQDFKPQPQSSEGATRALKLSRDEALIDWNIDADRVSAKIRAFTSNPGAWTRFRGAIIKVATPHPSNLKLAPGELLFREKKLYIGTGTTALEIWVITSAGKSAIPATSWANGARLVDGERCE